MSNNILIIIATVIISIITWRNEPLLQRLIFHPHTVLYKKQYYRLLTSGFIHQGWMHLIFNMLALFFFGKGVERIFNYIFPGIGGVLFIFFYISAIIISDLPTLRKQKENPHYFSLGASGGVSAIVFCWIMFFPLETIYVYFIPLPGFILGILYLVYSYYQSKNPDSHINHDAHLYGAVYGILFTIIVYPKVIPRFIEQISDFSIF